MMCKGLNEGMGEPLPIAVFLQRKENPTSEIEPVAK
jgi:hypothetical protein